MRPTLRTRSGAMFHRPTDIALTPIEVTVERTYERAGGSPEDTAAPKISEEYYRPLNRT